MLYILILPVLLSEVLLFFIFAVAIFMRAVAVSSAAVDNTSGAVVPGLAEVRHKERAAEESLISESP